MSALAIERLKEIDKLQSEICQKNRALLKAEEALDQMKQSQRSLAHGTSSKQPDNLEVIK